MAGFKETPRQKMIAMMYLVLTALLALNVSVEILNAFVTVNEGMQSSNESLTEKVSQEYSNFIKQNQLQPEKVGKYYAEAQEIKTSAENLITYIDGLKLELVAKTENVSPAEAKEKYLMDVTVDDATSSSGKKTIHKINLAKVGAKDKYDEATRILVKRKKGYELAEKMKDFRNKVLKIKNIDPNSNAASSIGLDTDVEYKDKDGLKQDWVHHNFNQIILAADITILNKIINEVRSLEFDAVNSLYSMINEKDFKFDAVQAKVIPSSTYVLKDGTYEAEVLVAALDTKNNVSASVVQGKSSFTDADKSGAKMIQGEDGKVKISFPASRVGEQKYAGEIYVKGPQGQTTSYPFSGSYNVAPPSLTVAATKMNVFYIGVDNPVDITVPGVASDNIHPRINSGGTLKKDGKGNYFVRVSKGMKEAVVSATADINGQEVPMGKSVFRVKRVPNPVAEVGGMIDGKIIKNKLLAANAIIPQMKDFVFDLYFTVQSFNMSTIVNGDNVTKRTKGNKFSDEMVQLIKNARPGQKFYFENIVAVGPDKTPRSLSPIVLEIQ